VTASGIETPALTAGPQRVSIAFDFLAHQLVITSSERGAQTVALEPRSVAAFYGEVMAALECLGVAVKIWPMDASWGSAVPSTSSGGASISQSRVSTVRVHPSAPRPTG